MLSPRSDDDLLASLRARRPVADAMFDRLYPPRWRPPSRRFWTPVRVALQAASWLDEEGPRRVLDVGSGVGKVCIVGALATRSTFTGIEQRLALVRAASTVAKRLSIEDRALFVHGTVETIDFSKFDAFYIYNPFGENLKPEGEWLDKSVELGEERFFHDLAVVERALDEAPIGTRLVTYHGLGGRVPDSYTMERNHWDDLLRLWVKRRAHKSGSYVAASRGALPANSNAVVEVELEPEPDSGAGG